jgi:hypothetical protein
MSGNCYDIAAMHQDFTTNFKNYTDSNGIRRI